MFRSPGTVERGAVRTFSALVVATGLVITLAGCGSSDSGLDGIAACDPEVTEGEASVLINAEGSGEPALEFPTPLVATELERSFERVGDGEILEGGDIAVMKFSQSAGSTGESISTWGSEPSFAAIGSEEGIPGQILECAPIGSRVNAVVPVKLIDPQSESTDSLVVTIDVLDGFEGKADGAPQLPSNDLPAIALAPNGQPGFSVPNADAPTDLRTSVLQRGDGKVVSEGDAVIVQFAALKWSTNSVDFTTWESGQPFALQLDGEDSIQQPTEQNPSAPTLYVPSTVKAQLDGLPLGSQVLVSVPAEEAGQLGLEQGDAMVYVIDLLSIQ